MLPRASRLHRASDFAEVVRRGHRVSRPLLTVHALPPDDGAGGDAPPRAGLVVSKAVGTSVERHRTSRRLRHLLGARLAGLPPGTRVVVRAGPPAAAAPSTALAADLDAALGTALRPRRRR